MPRRRGQEDALSLPPDNYDRLRQRLTPNEQVVADLFLKLLDDKLVARILNKRPQTIHNHIASILRKTKVSSRVELVYFVCTGRRAQQPSELRATEDTWLK